MRIAARSIPSASSASSSIISAAISRTTGASLQAGRELRRALGRQSSADRPGRPLDRLLPHHSESGRRRHPRRGPVRRQLLGLRRQPHARRPVAHGLRSRTSAWPIRRTRRPSSAPPTPAPTARSFRSAVPRITCGFTLTQTFSIRRRRHPADLYVSMAACRPGPRRRLLIPRFPTAPASPGSRATKPPSCRPTITSTSHPAAVGQVRWFRSRLQRRHGRASASRTARLQPDQPQLPDCVRHASRRASRC